MSNADTLLEVINECVDKKINSSNINSKIIGSVIEVSNDNKIAKVSVAESESTNNIFTLLNKSGELLQIGDNVFIENINGNLTNGFVSEKFGQSKNLFDVDYNNSQLSTNMDLSVNNIYTQNGRRVMDYRGIVTDFNSAITSRNIYGEFFYYNTKFSCHRFHIWLFRSG